MLILVFILSLVPAVLIFIWLKRRKAEDSEYKNICTSALKRGAIPCALLVLPLSVIFFVIERILAVLGVGAVPRAIYYNFIVLALAEELAKYRILKSLLKKNPYPCSWLDVTSLMMIVGIGFQITESIVYAFGANAGMMLVRGLTAMHCGYGFIMGYFIGKGMKTGQKRYTVLGILLPFILHGLYDTCLSEVLGEISDKFAYVSLALAAASLVILAIAFIHIHKAGKKAEYTEALGNADLGKC